MSARGSGFLDAGRVGLAVAALCLLVAGVVVATEGVAASETAAFDTSVAPAPAASSTCAAAGPYAAPEPGSVGLPPSLRLCPSGPLTITTPGAVLDGMELRGGLVVDAPDVVVRRSRITGDGSAAYGVVTTAAGSVRIEDTTVTGAFTEAAVGGTRWTAERVEVVGVDGDGAHAGAGSRLRASVLSRFAPGADTDGLVVLAPDVVVEGTTIRMGEAHHNAVRIDPGGAVDDPIVLRANVLGGGEYTVAGSGAADVQVVDNRFARDSARAPLRVGPMTTSRGNTYLDGAPVG